MKTVQGARTSGFRTGRAVTLTVLALICFALNSLLCRAALGSGLIDASSFTLVRLASGALVLFLLARPGASVSPAGAPGAWDRAASALALFMTPASSRIEVMTSGDRFPIA